ncbi:hypothetical protein [Cetobacterium sp.]|uniref:hypothetical protein n=1 Tax=Cetobacterium sp. TaxID=2071632 RepID=UPI003EE5C629
MEINLEQLIKDITMIYLESGIVDFKLFREINLEDKKYRELKKLEKEFLNNVPMDRKKCSVKLYKYFLEINNKNDLKDLMKKLYFFNVTTNRKVNLFSNKEAFEDIKNYHKIGDIEELDKDIITLLINLGFFDEVKSYYIGCWEVVENSFFKMLSKLKNKYGFNTMVNYGVDSVNNFFKHNYPTEYTLKGNYEVANLELIRLYKNHKLSIRDMENYPLFSNNRLKRLSKTTYQNYSQLEKEYRTTLICKRAEEIFKIFHFDHYCDLIELEQKQKQFKELSKNNKILKSQKNLKKDYSLQKGKLEEKIKSFKQLFLEDVLQRFTIKK